MPNADGTTKPPVTHVQFVAAPVRLGWRPMPDYSNVANRQARMIRGDAEKDDPLAPARGFPLARVSA
jgi:hypothetical protein